MSDEEGGQRVSMVTVTLNPAIDLTVMLDGLRVGELNRATGAIRRCGGKGVNVAANLAGWMRGIVASGLVGADSAGLFGSFLYDLGIEDRFVRVAGEPRTNIKLVDGSGTTDLNLPGPEVTAARLEELAASIDPFVRQARVVVLAGNLPPGLGDDSYARLLGRSGWRREGLGVVLDTSGAALDAALAPGAVLPFCVKPNREELAAHVGRTLPTVGEAAAAAMSLVARGVKLVAASLGADGAVFADAEGVLHGHAAAVEVVSTVGAGDAMVAGIGSALVDGLDKASMVARAMAFAEGRVASRDGTMPGRGAIEAMAGRVRVEAVSV